MIGFNHHFYWANIETDPNACRTRAGGASCWWNTASAGGHRTETEVWDYLEEFAGGSHELSKELLLLLIQGCDTINNHIRFFYFFNFCLKVSDSRTWRVRKDLRRLDLALEDADGERFGFLAKQNQTLSGSLTGGRNNKAYATTALWPLGGLKPKLKRSNISILNSEPITVQLLCLYVPQRLLSSPLWRRIQLRPLQASPAPPEEEEEQERWKFNRCRTKNDTRHITFIITMWLVFLQAFD